MATITYVFVDTDEGRPSVPRAEPLLGDGQATFVVDAEEWLEYHDLFLRTGWGGYYDKALRAHPGGQEARRNAARDLDRFDALDDALLRKYRHALAAAVADEAHRLYVPFVTVVDAPYLEWEPARQWADVRNHPALTRPRGAPDGKQSVADYVVERGYDRVDVLRPPGGLANAWEIVDTGHRPPRGA